MTDNQDSWCGCLPNKSMLKSPRITEFSHHLYKRRTHSQLLYCWAVVNICMQVPLEKRKTHFRLLTWQHMHTRHVDQRGLPITRILISGSEGCQQSHRHSALSGRCDWPRDILVCTHSSSS